MTKLDGLLSIVSHSTNQIFDQNHGKGSLGLAITAILYMHQHPDAVLVGLDTQLAREWLADRDDGKLPDLIGIRFFDSEEESPAVDLIEVKTYDDFLFGGIKPKVVEPFKEKNRGLCLPH